MDIKMQNAIMGRTIQLTQYEIAVLVALSWTVDNHDSSPPSPSIKWVANKMAISIGSVKKAIESLHAKKVVKRISKRRTDSGQFCNVYHVDIGKLYDVDVKARNKGAHHESQARQQEFTRVHEGSPRDNNTNIYTNNKKVKSVYDDNDKINNCKVSANRTPDKTCAVVVSSSPKPAYSIKSEEEFMMWARRKDVASALMMIMAPYLPGEGKARKTSARRIVELLFRHLVARDVKPPNKPIAYVGKVLDDKITDFVHAIKQKEQEEMEDSLKCLVRLRGRLAELQCERKTYAENGCPEWRLNELDERIGGIKKRIDTLKGKLNVINGSTSGINGHVST